MRRGCLWVPLLSWGIVAGFTTHVRAQPRGVVLEWSDTSDCANGGVLAAEVERLLGRPLSEAPATHVRAVVLRREPELRLELHMERDEGGSSRTLDGPTCDALVRAGALVIAVAIDPEAVAELQDSEPDVGGADPRQTAPAGVASLHLPARSAPLLATSASEPPPRRVAPPIPEPAGELPPDAPTDDARENIDVRFIASVLPALSFGPLPGPAPAIALSLGVGLGPVELTLGALTTAEQDAQLDGSVEGGRLGLALGRLRGCASLHPVDEWLELLPCLAIEAGAVWGHGTNVPIVRSGAAPWVAGAAALEARFWIVDAFALGLSADLLVPFMRPGFVLTLEDEPHELHRAHDVGALFGVTVTLRLR